MKLFKAASGVTLTQGLEYHTRGTVYTCQTSEEGILNGRVSGRPGVIHTVSVHPHEPKACGCDCLFSTKNRTVCKHMIALYLHERPHATRKAERMAKRKKF